MNHLYDWLILIGGICFLFAPWPMMIVTWQYINKTPRRQRLIELGYGVNNDWYRGKKVDFIDANYIFSMLAVGALIWSKLHFLVIKRKKLTSI